MTSNGGKFELARSIPVSKLDKDFLRAGLGGAHVVAATSLADITSLSVPLRAGVHYAIEAWFLSVQTVAIGILGTSFAYTGAIGGAGFIQSASISMSASAQTSGSNAALNTPIVESAARAVGSVNFPVYLNGFIGTSTAGNLTVRAQRSAGTHTVNYGWLLAWEF